MRAAAAPAARQEDGADRRDDQRRDQRADRRADPQADRHAHADRSHRDDREDRDDRNGAGGPPRLLSAIRSKGFATRYQVGLEAVGALAVATLAGAWADARFGTAPWLLIAGSAVGFGSCVLRIWRFQRAQEEASQSGRSEGSEESPGAGGPDGRGR